MAEFLQELCASVGASLVWALDFLATRDLELTERALALRDKALAPLRRIHRPPALPGPDDTGWADIPAGTFWMGAGPNEGRNQQQWPEEYPRHQVTLSTFRMSKNEVTNSEYRQLMPSHEGDDELPAGMNWYQAYTYAAWAGGRLPTESEWEYAARAGCRFLYCRSDGSEAALEEVAWWRDNSIVPETGKISTKAVGQLEPNPFGLWDMYGNAAEWNANWFNAYSEKAETDPAGPPSVPGDLRSCRPFSVAFSGETVAPSFRSGVGPNESLYVLGGRVVIPESLGMKGPSHSRTPR